MKRHMKRNTGRTRCVLHDDVWAGNGCSYTLKTGLHERQQYQSALSKLLLPAKLLTNSHFTSSLIQFEFKLNSTAFQWQQFVLEMRYAKMPMQDVVRGGTWTGPIPEQARGPSPSGSPHVLRCGWRPHRKLCVADSTNKHECRVTADTACIRTSVY